MSLLRYVSVGSTPSLPMPWFPVPQIHGQQWHNEWVTVFHEKGFQLSTPFQCWEILKSGNISYVLEIPEMNSALSLFTCTRVFVSVSVSLTCLSVSHAYKQSVDLNPQIQPVYHRVSHYDLNWKVLDLFATKTSADVHEVSEDICGEIRRAIQPSVTFDTPNSDVYDIMMAK